MSKNHIQDPNNFDVDALLDEYQKTKHIKSVVPHAQSGISFDDPEKKKSWLQRLLTYLHLPNQL